MRPALTILRLTVLESRANVAAAEAELQRDLGNYELANEAYRAARELRHQHDELERKSWAAARERRALHRTETTP